MRYLNHQFANPETLDRARRWLVQVGFEPDQIEAINEGVPRIAIRVSAAQGAVAGMIIDAAERTDPDGLPSFWDLAQHQHVQRKSRSDYEGTSPLAAESRSFVLAYRVPDDRPDLGTSLTAIEMRDAYLDSQLF